MMSHIFCSIFLIINAVFFLAAALGFIEDGFIEDEDATGAVVSLMFCVCSLIALATL